MPLLKASIKDVRKTKRRTLDNKGRDSRIRTAIKKVRTAKNADEARELFAKVEPMLDKATKKGLYHKNKTARLKARLRKYIATIGK